MSKEKNTIEDWSLLTQDKARFLFNQTELYLQNTLEIKKSIEEKALKFAGVYTNIFAFAIGTIITLVEKTILDASLLIPLVVLAVFTGISLLLCLQVFTTKKFNITGNEPKNLWKWELIKQKEAFILYNESMLHQEYISKNNAINRLSLHLFKLAQYIGLGSMLLAFLLWFAIKFLN